MTGSVSGYWKYVGDGQRASGMAGVAVVNDLSVESERKWDKFKLQVVAKDKKDLVPKRGVAPVSTSLLSPPSQTRVGPVGSRLLTVLLLPLHDPRPGSYFVQNG